MQRMLEASPGCRAAFGEVRAREHRGERHPELERLSIDAYGVQHPGRPSPQSTFSLCCHLVRLCLMLDYGFDRRRADSALLTIAQLKERFVRLTPPPSLGSVTVAQVRAATSPEQLISRVRDWAEVAWSAWEPHHHVIRSWIPTPMPRLGPV